MRKKLSIIVPILNERELVGPFLEHLSGLDRIADAEIIVVDGGSDDGSVQIVGNHPVTLVETGPGRSKQLNAGARQATGDILLFVHVDSRLPENAITQILSRSSRVNQAGSFRLTFDSSNWMLRSFAWFTRFDFRLFRFGDQGLFLSRRLFKHIRGYDESLKVMEDQEIVRRLSKLVDFTILPQRITTSSRKYEQHGVVYTQLAFTLIVILYYLGASQTLISRLHSNAFPSGSRKNGLRALQR